MPNAERSHFHSGVLLATGAYLCWGFFPLFWKLLAERSPWEILAHRIFWGFIFFVVLLFFSRRLSALLKLLRQPRLLIRAAISAALVSTNWLLFTYAINTGQVLESSLGYFINPLFNILLGVFFLKESLSTNQKKAFILLSMALLILFIEPLGIASKNTSTSPWPWLSLTLAITFSLYGYVRKLSAQDPLVMSTAESLLLTPLALGLFVVHNQIPNAKEALQTAPLYLFIAGGFLTAGTLFLFILGARKLPYSTLGFLQFLSPTLQFVIAYFVFHESISQVRLMAFFLIGFAGLLAMYDLRKSWRNARTSP